MIVWSDTQSTPVKLAAMTRRPPTFTRFDTPRGPVFAGPDHPEPFAALILGLTLAAAGFGLAEVGTGSSVAGGLAAGLGAGVAALLTRGARFRLRLAPEGPTLERTLLGLTYARLALPTDVRARREGLLDWGDDGEDGREALTGLTLEGPEAPFEPLLIGARDDADTLPAAIEAALDRAYPGARDTGQARLDLNRPWNARLQDALAARLGGRRPRDPLTIATPFAGLIEWETPTLSVLGALGLLAGAGVAHRLGADGPAFALPFSVCTLSAWRLLQLVREDRARVELGADRQVARIVFERRWLGLCLRRRSVEAPRFVTLGSWQAAHPQELSAWPAEGLALDAQRAALDAQGARAWRAVADP